MHQLQKYVRQRLETRVWTEGAGAGLGPRRSAPRGGYSDLWFALSWGNHLSPSEISTELIPPGVSSSHDHPWGSADPSTLRLQVPASLPVDLMLIDAISLSPGLTLTGSVGISKVTLNVGMIDKVLV